MLNNIRKGACRLLFLLLLLPACTQTRTGGTLSVATPDFFGIGDDLAIQLKANLRPEAGSRPQLIMATFVNIDDLTLSSRFGRTLPEALANRLFRHGFRVLEIRKSDELLVKSRNGELVLSRNAERLAASVAADGIVSGTYSLTPGTVIVSIRLLDAASQEVLSVADMEIQRSQAIDSLLSGGVAYAGGRRPAMSAYEQQVTR